MNTTKKTIIVFSGDLDKLMAAFIIANGAAAMDDEVTMFFTFWGLTALRRSDSVATARKSRLQKAFSTMLPRGPERAGLSHMNFGGLGPRMMKRVMRQQNVTTLTELIDTAREQGVKFVACTMSMDVMGFAKDELIDGVEFAGVATYLGEADEANVNLFI